MQVAPVIVQDHHNSIAQRGADDGIQTAQLLVGDATCWPGQHPYRVDRDTDLVDPNGFQGPDIGDILHSGRLVKQGGPLTPLDSAASRDPGACSALTARAHAWRLSDEGAGAAAKDGGAVSRARQPNPIRLPNCPPFVACGSGQLGNHLLISDGLPAVHVRLAYPVQADTPDTPDSRPLLGWFGCRRS